MKNDKVVCGTVINRRAFINAFGLGVGAASFISASGCSFLQGGSGNDPLIVALMGDPQYPMVEETPRYIAMAMRDLRTLPHEFLAVLGDLVQAGKPQFYPDFTESVLDKSRRPVFCLPGNSDLGAGLKAYQEVTGNPVYYAIRRRGIRFIFTGVTQMSGEHKHICHLGQEQMDWLKKELASDAESTTIIFSHPPVFETTWHSEDRSKEKMPGSLYLHESAEMRALFAQYPNIKIFAHGHIHHKYGEVDSFGRGTYCMEDGVLHISVGATANNQGSSFLFIGKDNIVARARDHQNQAWMPEHEYVLSLKTTLTAAK